MYLTLIQQIMQKNMTLLLYDMSLIAEYNWENYYFKEGNTAIWHLKLATFHS